MQVQRQSHPSVILLLTIDLSGSNCRTTSTPLWRRSPEGETICNACGLYLKARNTARPSNLKRPHSTSFPFTGSDMDGSERQRSLSPTAADRNSKSSYVVANQTGKGSCPGGGHCDGTGGAEGCNGCPAYNNRVSKTTWVSSTQIPKGTEQEVRNDPNAPQSFPDESPRQSISQETPNGNQATSGLTLSCQNCGTTITPLWRRDESGRTICNACGRCSLPSFCRNMLPDSEQDFTTNCMGFIVLSL